MRKVTAGTQAAALTLTLGGAPTQRAARPGRHHRHGEVRHALLARGDGLRDDPRHEVRVRLTPATAKLAAGTRTLTLRFPAAEQKRFRKLLKPGQQARAVITVKATDKAGNTVTSKRTVTVRR